MDHDELAVLLRTWRDRLTPEAAGLPAGSGGRRRAPGLRREEVAQLAGLSVDYLARLEQGRATSPSPSVLAPLARALRLSDDERAHLFRVAGQAPPLAGHIDRHITPGVQRILDRLGDVPVLVIDAAYFPVAANALGVALVGARDANIAWRHFTGGASRFVREPEERERMSKEVVGDLRAALGRYPDDPRLRTLIDELLEASPEFAALWEQAPVGVRAASRKTIDHPEVGRITLDCDSLHVAGSDLRLIVYTAEPGSEEAGKLALLATIGTQTFAPGD
jgi:transcriptional regulator with XRE-family HTH domain